MATITFKVKQTGTAEYFMEDEDYEVLINEYGGDVIKFIRELDIDDSYVSYCEYDINGIDYKDEEIKQGILEYTNKKGVILDEDMEVDKELSYELQLNNYKHNDLIPDLVQLNIDKNLALQVYKFADINNPKKELDCIRVYGDTIIATDTRLLIVAKHKEMAQIEVFIPSCFVWTLDKDGELFVDEDAKVYLKYDELFYSTKDKKLIKYPDTDRILPKEFNWSEIKTEQIDFYGAKAVKFGNGAVIDKKYWDIIEPFGFTQYSQSDKNTPIYFMRNGIEIMIMPLVD